VAGGPRLGGGRLRPSERGALDSPHRQNMRRGAESMVAALQGSSTTISSASRSRSKSGSQAGSIPNTVGFVYVGSSGASHIAAEPHRARCPALRDRDDHTLLSPPKVCGTTEAAPVKGANAPTQGRPPEPNENGRRSHRRCAPSSRRNAFGCPRRPFRCSAPSTCTSVSSLGATEPSTTSRVHEIPYPWSTKPHGSESLKGPLPSAGSEV